MENKNIDPANNENPVQENENTTTNTTAGSADGESMDKLKQELGETKEKYVRLYSDFENFRRRTAKERIELISTASESLILSLLPVLDDFERAQKAAAAKSTAEGDIEKQGYALIYNKFYRLLEQKGLKPIEAVGQPFSTELHEAITQIPAPSPDLKGKVVDEVEKGYYLGEKVIRFAKVVIGT